MGTIIVAVIVIGVAGLAVRSIVVNKKKGKSVQCGCDCKHCNGGCH